MGKSAGLSYDIKKKDVNTKELVEKYCKNELDDAAFLKEAPNAEFYYSTLSDEQYHGGLEEDEGYLPLFVSEEDLREYYDKAGRKDYPVVKKSFLSIVQTALKANHESPDTYGLIIDPAGRRISFDASAIRPAFYTMLRENDHFLFGTLLLIFLDGLYIGSYAEVRKREKVFDAEINRKPIIERS